MISVVIPTHNREDLITRAICSVQNQSYIDLEIIVVSDGSTDNTRQIVGDMAENDKRIKYIEYFPAQGGNHARNIGIENANGEYIAFLDDDDEWSNDKLKRQIEVIADNTEIGMVYTGVNIIYDELKLSYNSTSNEFGDLSKRILLGNCISTTSSVLIRKGVFTLVGVFDPKLKALQDYDLWIRVCQKYSVGVISDPMVNYHNSLATSQISSVTQKYIDAWEYLDCKYDNLLKKLSIKERKKRKENVYCGLVLRALRNNEKKVAQEYARKLIKSSLFKGLKYYLCTLFSYKTLIRMRSKKK